MGMLKWIANLCMGQVMKQIRADLDFAEWRGRTNAENAGEMFGDIQDLKRNARTVQYAGKPYCVDLLESKVFTLELAVKQIKRRLPPEEPINREDTLTGKGE